MSMSFLFDREVWLLAEYVEKDYWELANRDIEREKEIDRERERERHFLSMKGIVF